MGGRLVGEATAVEAAEVTGERWTVLGVGGDADTASILSGDGDVLYTELRDCEEGTAISDE